MPKIKKKDKLKEDVKRKNLIDQVFKQLPVHVLVGYNADGEPTISLKGDGEKIFKLLGSLAMEDELVKAMFVEIGQWITEQASDPKIAEKPAIKIVGGSAEITKAIREGR